MKAAGYRWAWWNQYGSVRLDECVRRAKEADIGVICKWGFWDAFNAFKRAGLRVAIERYAYPHQPALEAERLAGGIDLRAEFAVINAEVEWEGLGADEMRRLIHRFRQLQPSAELYASVDTRGNRMTSPYQRVLAEHVAGWMPMIYPKAFLQPVGAAFAAALDGKDFRGKPVLPTIQGYDKIGTAAVREQVAEVERRGLPGCQLYTITHATAREWQAYVSAIPEEDIDMGTADELRQEIETLRKNTVTGFGYLGGAIIKVQKDTEAGFVWVGEKMIKPLDERLKVLEP